MVSGVPYVILDGIYLMLKSLAVNWVILVLLQLSHQLRMGRGGELFGWRVWHVEGTSLVCRTVHSQDGETTAVSMVVMPGSSVRVSRAPTS